MVLEKFGPWLTVMFPLVCSAGPTNVIFAASAAQFGIIKLLPFTLSTRIVFFLESLVVGFGLGEVLNHYPQLVKYTRYIGAIYLLYLAYKLFRSPDIKIKASSTAPTFYDGLILQMLNVKALVNVLLMFSLFIDDSSPQFVQVLTLSATLLVVAIISAFVWQVGGIFMAKLFRFNKLVRVQGYVFGSMLVAVAVWMTF